jgi:hypothetical protein
MRHFILALVLCAGTCVGQEMATNSRDLPAAPAVNTSSFDLGPSTAGNPAIGYTQTTYQRPLHLHPYTSPEQKSNKVFWIEAAAMAAAAVADVETTRAAVRSGAVERNFIFGSQPSAARLYGITLPVTAGQILLARWLRRGEHGKAADYMSHGILLGGATAHGIAAAMNSKNIR